MNDITSEQMKTKIKKQLLFVEKQFKMFILYISNMMIYFEKIMKEKQRNERSNMK